MAKSRTTQTKKQVRIKYNERERESERKQKIPVGEGDVAFSKVFRRLCNPLSLLLNGHPRFFPGIKRPQMGRERAAGKATRYRNVDIPLCFHS
jgi:hypothetical protein